MSLTKDGRPAFSPKDVLVAVAEIYNLNGRLTPLPAEWDQNFKLEVPSAGDFVIKIAHRDRPLTWLDCENQAMSHLARSWPFPVPRPVAATSGETITTLQDQAGCPHFLRLLTYLPGQPLSAALPLDQGLAQDLGRALGKLTVCLADFDHPAAHRDFRWDLRRAEQIRHHTAAIPHLAHRALVERLLLQFRARVKPLWPDLPCSVIHNDAHDENLLLQLDEGDRWRLAGLLDFGDLVYSHTINELAVSCGYLSFAASDPLALMAAIVAAYCELRPLNESELQALFPLINLRLAMSVTNSALAALADPENPHRQISDRPAWTTLEKLASVDWPDAENRFRRACDRAPRPAPDPGRPAPDNIRLRQARRRLIGPSLSLSYREPLVILRGQGQFLFDDRGQAYLDCVNNVAHVGHSHPQVVAALADQAALLNTNTRYLHPLLLEYARRLTATLPEPLRVCYFVNSGSEANELAVRLARTHTGRRQAIVLDGAYHGNTQTLVELSPYKCEGPGGQGLPAWVHKVPKPDGYRGLYRGRGEEIGRAYAAHVREACERLNAAGRPPGLFLVEPILGCGGQIILPDGYLAAAFSHVRAVGALCIADEVQVGLGRVGDSWWAFESQGVVPDIVTIGKPAGNGHPLGAVVTTPVIAASFANGMEFFSTFGGNPVSMAVGLAVLDVIEAEGLRQRAAQTGRYLVAGFNSLAENHPLIGDVRGLGLFMGIELVRNRETLEPATEETARLIEALKEEGFLLSAEGPHHNVLKLKPPLQFDQTDADLLLSAVDRLLVAL